MNEDPFLHSVRSVILALLGLQELSHNSLPALFRLSSAKRESVSRPETIVRRIRSCNRPDAERSKRAKTKSLRTYLEFAPHFHLFAPLRPKFSICTSGLYASVSKLQMFQRGADRLTFFAIANERHCLSPTGAARKTPAVGFKCFTSKQ